MTKEDLIKEIKKPSPKKKWFRKYVLNRYTITIFAFLIWMTFFDNTSFLVINELNQEISRDQTKLDYYKTEYEKNDEFYKRLMNNKAEREKYARENYFMKKKDEEIFILVPDTIKTKK